MPDATPLLGDGLPTEQPNPRTKDIDLCSTVEVLQLLNAEDMEVPKAVNRAIPAMARAVELMVSGIRRGGTVHYYGAGTSGRLAIGDAAEIPPTFGVSPDLFKTHMAGGGTAGAVAMEDAEDDEEAGAAAAKDLDRSDIAIGVAASGRTPYVCGALRAARGVGAATILISSNPGAAMGKEVDCHIGVDTGPEVIAGSTRLKAGTATKLVLNSLSTAVMVALGRTYSHFMVNMKAKNSKLRARAVRILVLATGLPVTECSAALEASEFELDTALTALLGETDPRAARQALDGAGGSVRRAVAALGSQDGA